MCIECFNKKIDIDAVLIQEYEKSVAPFNSRRAEYFAITSGANISSSISDITSAIIEGLQDEISLYKNKEAIVLQACEKGIF